MSDREKMINGKEKSKQKYNINIQTFQTAKKTLFIFRERKIQNWYMRADSDAKCKVSQKWIQRRILGEGGGQFCNTSLV